MPRRPGSALLEQGFTLLEIMLAIAIGLLLLGIAVPSIAGMLQDEKLKQTFADFNEFAQKAQVKAVKDRRTYIMVWEKDDIALLPLDPMASDEGAEPEHYAIPDGAKITLDRPAALVKKPVWEWPFWRSGACEPVVVHYEGPGGTWAAEYNALTGHGKIVAMEVK